MVDLSTEELKALKGKGFLLQKDKSAFVCRLVLPVGIASAKDLRRAARLSQQYGDGRILTTVRLNLEIPGIAYENVYPMMEEMDRLGILYGGTGACVRPVVACKGTFCKFGMVDTHAIGTALHDDFYHKAAPHKFKINVTGCGNNCAKVQLNDIGFMGAPQNKLRVFIGGRFGRKSIMGDEVCTIAPENASRAVDLCLAFYNDHGKANQRFGELLKLMIETPEYQKLIDDLHTLA